MFSDTLYKRGKGLSTRGVMRQLGMTTSAGRQRLRVPLPSGRRTAAAWAERLHCRGRGFIPESGGASAVEFAFILPVLLFLLIGMIDVAVLLMTQNRMASVAHDTARRLSLSQMTAPEAQDYVRDKLEALGDTLKVEALLPNTDEGEVDVIVTISIPMADVIPIDLIGMNSIDTFRAKSLQTQITMQQEVQQ